jgi:hypothetical protein
VFTNTWVFAKRLVTLTTVAATIYVVVGCTSFPDWWFRFLWGGRFDWQYVAEGSKILADEYFPLLIGIVAAICVAAIVGTLFKAQIFRFADKFTGQILFAALVIAFTTALVVYHTQQPNYVIQSIWEINLLSQDYIQKFLAASNSPPIISAPVDFQYLDKERVDALYSQVEPELTEKERTVATTGSTKGKVGLTVGGAVSAEAEAGKGVSSTSSFARANFSRERKCIELMNYVVRNKNPKYYRNINSWFLGRENAALAVQMEQNKRAPIDLSKLRRSEPLDDPETIAGRAPTDEEKREAIRKAKQYESELQNELKSLDGYVFIDGVFEKTMNGDNMVFVENFSTKPLKILFRMTIPPPQLPNIENLHRLRLRVFGDVIRPLDSDGYVDIRTIAVY